MKKTMVISVVLHVLLLFIIATVISRSDTCWYVITKPDSTTPTKYVVEALQGIRIIDSSSFSKRFNNIYTNTVITNTVLTRRKQYIFEDQQQLKYESLLIRKRKKRNYILVSLLSLSVDSVDSANEDDVNNTNTNTNTIINDNSGNISLQQQQQQQSEQQGAKATTRTTTTTTTTSSSPVLFSLDQSTSIATTTTKSFDFGQSVSIRDRPTATSVPIINTDTIELTKPDTFTTTTTTTTTTSSSTSIKIKNDYEIVQDIKRRNSIVGIGSVGIGLIKYMYQYYNPKQPIQLLVEMTNHSPSVTTIGTNNKPTIIDFWAPWCDTCQQLAPTLYSLKEQYVGLDNDSTNSNNANSLINFISIDGNEIYNANIVSKFHVDAIPHIAFITADGDVITALIGPVPRSVLQANIDYLIQYTSSTTTNNNNAASKSKNTKTIAASTTSTVTDVNQLIQDLPYTMFDAFENLPSRRIQFTPEEILQIQQQQQQIQQQSSSAKKLV